MKTTTAIPPRTLQGIASADAAARKEPTLSAAEMARVPTRGLPAVFAVPVRPTGPTLSAPLPAGAVPVPQRDPFASAMLEMKAASRPGEVAAAKVQAHFEQLVERSGLRPASLGQRDSAGRTARGTPGTPGYFDRPVLLQVGEALQVRAARDPETLPFLDGFAALSGRMHRFAAADLSSALLYEVKQGGLTSAEDRTLFTAYATALTGDHTFGIDYQSPRFLGLLDARRQSSELREKLELAAQTYLAALAGPADAQRLRTGFIAALSALSPS